MSLVSPSQKMDTSLESSTELRSVCKVGQIEVSGELVEVDLLRSAALVLSEDLGPDGTSILIMLVLKDDLLCLGCLDSHKHGVVEPGTQDLIRFLVQDHCLGIQLVLEVGGLDIDLHLVPVLDEALVISELGAVTDVPLDGLLDVRYSP